MRRGATVLPERKPFSASRFGHAGGLCAGGVGTMAGKRLEDRFVVPGPKEPEWVCSFCNRSGNWASRTKCRCGKEAPSNLRQRALEAAKKCSSSGKKSSSESVVASGGKGKALPREVDDRIKKLEQALADRVLMGERSLPASMSNQGSGLLRWLQQARQAHRCHGPLDRSGGMTLPELRRAWQACSDRPPTRWSQVRGPIEAARVSAQRLVWTWLGACFVLVADGTRISLVENAPAAVAIEAQKAYFSDLQCKVAERARLGDAGGICLRPVWVVAADRELSASQRRLVQVVVCGGVWTNQRLQEAGYDVIPVCRCGNDIDSLHQAIPLPFVC